jgi:quinol-cytochrome oxidoreductase complex cytochrome b subunit
MQAVIEKFKESMLKSQIWKSMFRHDYEDSQRNRLLQVLDNVWLHLHPTKLPRHGAYLRFTWCMGGITFLLFLSAVIAVADVLLSPDGEYAFADEVSAIRCAVGMFCATCTVAAHAWSSPCGCICSASSSPLYKLPREFNWVVGVIRHHHVAAFTGYLLPWDQLSIWAVTVGTNMARATPLLGHEGPFGPQLGMRPDNDVRFMLLGGTQVGPPTLLRFYVLHCIFLPLFLAIFIAVHFWRVRKDGGISGPL